MAEINVTQQSIDAVTALEIADSLYDVTALLAVVMQRTEGRDDYETLRLLNMANEKVTAAAGVLG